MRSVKAVMLSEDGIIMVAVSVHVPPYLSSFTSLCFITVQSDGQEFGVLSL